MNESLTSSDWATTRGEKWLAQLACMEAMLTQIDEPLIDALQLDAPSAIADIGCGGGGTTLKLLQAAPQGSVVHGYDISSALIEAARARPGADHHAVTFDVADMSTAAPSKRYDRLASRFGIMFFPNPQAAFGNLARWLKPGGRFAFAAWARPADNPWFEMVRDVVAEAVDLPPLDPEAPGPFRYGAADKLLALLERAGFAELAVRDWRGSLPLGGGMPPAKTAQFALAAFSSFGDLLAQAGHQALDQACRSLTERFVPHHQDGAVRVDASIRIFTGTVGDGFR